MPCSASTSAWSGRSGSGWSSRACTRSEPRRLDGTVTTSVTVVKCGGSEAIQAGGVCADVAALCREGEQVVLVHGGSSEIERLAAQLRVPQRTLLAATGASSRYSDAATVDVLTLALAGRAKPRLLLALAAHGVPAVGLTGADAGLLRARRNAAQRAIVDGRTVVVRDDLSGRIVGVNTAVLRLLLDAGVTPVVSPPASSSRRRTAVLPPTMRPLRSSRTTTVRPSRSGRPAGCAASCTRRATRWSAAFRGWWSPTAAAGTPWPARSPARAPPSRCGQWRGRHDHDPPGPHGLPGPRRGSAP